MRFLDGPLAGFETDSRRCPVFVRGVVDCETKKKDVLNELDDQIKPSEDLYVYRIVGGTWRQVFVRPGGEYQSGDYRECDADTPLILLRDNERWRQWVESQ